MVDNLTFVEWNWSAYSGSILKVGDNPLFQGKFSIAFRFEKLEFEFGWPALLYVLFWGLFLVRSVSFTKQ